MFALVDCNNFYASCEKLFAPEIQKRPVVVLSNNDGCVVARSAEAKALGIPMGAPWFKLKQEARRHGIVAFSSNYALYADMSNRVIEVLNGFSPNIEVYSIDESFLDLTGFEGFGLQRYGEEIRQRVADWLGLAVCVGIAPTKTLAKLANHCAKKQLAGRNGVCDFSTLPPEERDQLFATIEVGDVWGIGKRIQSQLQAMKIRTVMDLCHASPALIRTRFSVVLERTVRELHGVSCLGLEEMVPAKQQIMSSRSFSQYVYRQEELQQAVTHHVSRAAEKLRQQDGLARALQVFIRTNPFNTKEAQYQKTQTLPLINPSDDTRTLTQWALKILDQIYQPGFAYQKTGVMLLEIQTKKLTQDDLFSSASTTERASALMETMDAINSRWGSNTITLLAEGTKHDNRNWQMRRELLSPAYTTKFNELAIAIAN